MSLRPYKFVIKAVPQILDDDGEVVGEELRADPVELIGIKQAVAWLQAFPEALAAEDARLQAAMPPPPNRAQRRKKPVR